MIGHQKNRVQSTKLYGDWEEKAGGKIDALTNKLKDIRKLQAGEKIFLEKKLGIFGFSGLIAMAAMFDVGRSMFGVRVFSPLYFH